ncbi:MAG TPA: glycosyltransferase [Solirubrobacteraceae bacterium]|nr:glycosyltransferase [Solirubrobacteraceae bacterium]
MTLVARLERPLPGSLPVGRATAIFCAGICFHPRERIARLELAVGDERRPVPRFGMPRPDVATYRSGFWVTVPIAARDRPQELVLRLIARLQNGGEEVAELGRLAIVEPEAEPSAGRLTPTPADAHGPLIAVCMATFEPDIALFTRQLESLRAQTDQRWVCVISDDHSTPKRFAQLESALAGDPRFAVSRAPQRLGFYRNFERALSLIGPEAKLIALCDQDDRWDSDKLACLRASLGSAGLVYSDLRLVEADGRVLRQTLWRGRSNNQDNLASMLIANTITGASMLFRRDLLELALPFPDGPGIQFHDHWLAAVALTAGEVAYVDRPLYDYVQHPGAVFGDVTHGASGRRAQHSLRQLSDRWRAAYVYGYLPRELQAQTLLARCPGAPPAKRRALEWFVDADRSAAAFIWLLVRPLRSLLGRTETLSSELELVRGLLARRLMSLTARLPRRLAGPFADAGPPPLDAFSQKRLRRWRASLARALD